MDIQEQAKRDYEDYRQRQIRVNYEQFVRDEATKHRERVTACGPQYLNKRLSELDINGWLSASELLDAETSADYEALGRMLVTAFLEAEE